MNPNTESKQNVHAAKACASTCVIIVVAPLMICDLYFGFSGDECLNEYPSQIHLNLKKYLLVCGFLSLFNIIYIILTLSCISSNEESNTMILVINIGISYLMGILLLVWNIMGAIIFWNFIFPEHTCGEELSNYLFASIIIKLVLSWGSFASRKKDD
jgi:hypothetical protein